jgi:glycopeptide antibiotics resistance protein
MSVSVYMCLSVYMFVCECVYVCLCVCVCVCVLPGVMQTHILSNAMKHVSPVAVLFPLQEIEKPFHNSKLPDAICIWFEILESWEI